MVNGAGVGRYTLVRAIYF